VRISATPSLVDQTYRNQKVLPVATQSALDVSIDGSSH
jgi:hypothetical protein